MPTFKGRYTLEYECTIEAPEIKAAYQELNRSIGLKNQPGTVLSIIRTDLPANHERHRTGEDSSSHADESAANQTRDKAPSR